MLVNIVILMVGFFLLNNLFFHDYRLEEMKQLRASGMSAEEIKSFVPYNMRERREVEKTKENEMEQLKEDVVKLKEEVQRLSTLLDNDISKNNSNGLDSMKVAEKSQAEELKDGNKNSDKTMES
eukprot:CAMPEP_0178934384 /NCGR_PEP_ID=MMETSP0786-20121207/23832_1 /TAXON_ID=186022 /ORGANISM="Thalassionema frauenfeldii, Strain CCMP 1798" /LENGTH=123 /DNA_ID=CAMNT_0020612159 /DNA_START=98 /DNA_END=469 /DNA_ORIENTATION=+